jgi:pre-mRNA-processing factor 19
LWDLRKLKNFKTLAPVDDAPTSCCAFDKSGNWLAVGGGAGVHVYGVKQVSGFPFSVD